MSSKATTATGLNVSVKKTVRPLTDAEGADASSRETLVPLSFKVTKSFKKRYQQAALNADMKLNELLTAMLDHWEKSKQPTQ